VSNGPEVVSDQPAVRAPSRDRVTRTPVYRRYAIASDADLREAAVKLAVVSELSKAPTGIMTNSVNGGGRSLSTT